MYLVVKCPVMSPKSLLHCIAMANTAVLHVLIDEAHFEQ